MSQPKRTTVAVDVDAAIGTIIGLAKGYLDEWCTDQYYRSSPDNVLKHMLFIESQLYAHQAVADDMTNAFNASHEAERDVMAKLAPDLHKLLKDASEVEIDATVIENRKQIWAYVGAARESDPLPDANGYSKVVQELVRKYTKGSKETSEKDRKALVDSLIKKWSTIRDSFAKGEDDPCTIYPKSYRKLLFCVQMAALEFEVVTDEDIARKFRAPTRVKASTGKKKGQEVPKDVAEARARIQENQKTLDQLKDQLSEAKFNWNPSAYLSGKISVKGDSVSGTRNALYDIFLKTNLGEYMPHFPGLKAAERFKYMLFLESQSLKALILQGELLQSFQGLTSSDQDAIKEAAPVIGKWVHATCPEGLEDAKKDLECLRKYVKKLGYTTELRTLPDRGAYRPYVATVVGNWEAFLYVSKPEDGASDSDSAQKAKREAAQQKPLGNWKKFVKDFLADLEMLQNAFASSKGWLSFASNESPKKAFPDSWKKIVVTLRSIELECSRFEAKRKAVSNKNSPQRHSRVTKDVIESLEDSCSKYEVELKYCELYSSLLSFSWAVPKSK